MRYHVTALILAFSISLLGCGSSGPPRASIQGAVSLNGQPITKGTITFVPVAGSTGGSSAASEILEGKYNIPADKGPTFGKYRVEIRWSKKTGNKIEMGSPAPPGTMVDEVKEAVPEKYNTKSTLEKDINSTKHDFEFKLDS